MLAEIYIESILVDEDLGDQVWEAWDNGEADNDIACIAWTLIVATSISRPVIDWLIFCCCEGRSFRGGDVGAVEVGSWNASHALRD